MRTETEVTTVDFAVWRLWRLVYEWPTVTLSVVTTLVLLVARGWLWGTVVGGLLAVLLWATISAWLPWGRKESARRHFADVAEACGLVSRSGVPARLIDYSRAGDHVILAIDRVTGVTAKDVETALPHLATWQNGVRATIDDKATAARGHHRVVVVRVVLHDVLNDPRTAGWVDDETERWSK